MKENSQESNNRISEELLENKKKLCNLEATLSEQENTLLQERESHRKK